MKSYYRIVAAAAVTVVSSALCSNTENLARALIQQSFFPHTQVDDIARYYELTLDESKSVSLSSIQPNNLDVSDIASLKELGWALMRQLADDQELEKFSMEVAVAFSYGIARVICKDEEAVRHVLAATCRKSEQPLLFESSGFAERGRIVIFEACAYALYKLAAEIEDPNLLLTTTSSDSLSKCICHTAWAIQHFSDESQKHRSPVQFGGRLLMQMFDTFCELMCEQEIETCS